MKVFISVLIMIFGTLSIHAQDIPTPKFPTRGETTKKQTDYIRSFTWNKTSSSDYTLFDSKGNRLTDVEFLTQLSSDTVAVLHKASRSILLLPDFDSVSEGGPRDGFVLKRGISTSFYITNPNSYITYVNDESYSPAVTNVDGSYVAYVAELDKTYLEEGIRSFSGWGVKDLKALPASDNNTYWYRDRNAKEYGIIVKGESMDYTNVTSEMDGDDRIVSDNGTPVYRLEDYANTASFVYKPVSTNVGGGTNTVTSSEGCVSGNCSDGFGKYEYENGYYDGFWKNGLKDGYGLYSWTDGGTYVGDWDTDKMTGYGVYTAENDDLIKGIFLNSSLNGVGVTRTGDDWKQGVWQDGDLITPYGFAGTSKSTGCTIGDCYDKYGKMEWANGDTYVGFFKNGALYVGTYSFASGDKYSGQFNQNSEFHGIGRFWFEDGTYYGGGWRNGQYHGLGYYSDDNDKKVGEFNNGSFVGPK